MNVILLNHQILLHPPRTGFWTVPVHFGPRGPDLEHHPQLLPSSSWSEAQVAAWIWATSQWKSSPSMTSPLPLTTLWSHWPTDSSSRREHLLLAQKVLVRHLESTPLHCLCYTVNIWSVGFTLKIRECTKELNVTRVLPSSQPWLKTDIHRSLIWSRSWINVWKFSSFESFHLQVCFCRISIPRCEEIKESCSRTNAQTSS